MYMTNKQYIEVMKGKPIINIVCRCGFKQSGLNRDQAIKLYNQHNGIYCFPKISLLKGV